METCKTIVAALVTGLSISVMAILSADEKDIPRQPDITAGSPRTWVDEEITPLQQAQHDIKVLNLVVRRQQVQIDQLIKVVIALAEDSNHEVQVDSRKAKPDGSKRKKPGKWSTIPTEDEPLIGACR